VLSEQWQPVVDRLVGALAGLRYPDVVIVAGADPSSESPWSRYIQYRQCDRYLVCECVGATSFGGDAPLTAEQDSAIRALGWRLPSEGSIEEPAPNYPNYHRTLAIDDASYAAALGAGALEALGLNPDELFWEVPAGNHGRGRWRGGWGCAFRFSWRRN
jgi:hypothetical protein